MILGRATAADAGVIDVGHRRHDAFNGFVKAVCHHLFGVRHVARLQIGRIEAVHHHDQNFAFVRHFVFLYR